MTPLVLLCRAHKIKYRDFNYNQQRLFTMRTENKGTNFVAKCQHNRNVSSNFPYGREAFESSDNLAPNHMNKYLNSPFAS